MARTQDTAPKKGTGLPPPEENKTANQTKRAPAVPKSNSDMTAEAKGLKELAKALSQKNAPETSKDITAFAKETLKIVTKSQKTESAAFKREATKALVEFRNFVEKTEKLSEVRRNKILSDIDGVTLDTKNATMMLLSVARTQAKTIKDAAKREASAEKLKLANYEKTVTAEADAKAKTIKSEAELKAKTLLSEHTEKMKTLSAERAARHKALMDQSRTEIQKQKDELKQKKADHAARMDQRRQELKVRQDKLKQDKDAHSTKVTQDKQDLKAAKALQKQNYDNLKAQLKASHDAKAQQLKQDKDAHKVQVQQDRLKLQTDRADAAAKIKKMKTDLRDDYNTKMRNAKADIAQKKADQAVRNKARIQRIRQMEVDHKGRMKKIEDQYRAEGILRKAALKRQISEQEKKVNKAKQDGDAFKKTLASGVYDANPVLAAGAEIFKGVKGLVTHKKEKTKLNTLGSHANGASQVNAKGAAPAPANGPNNGPAPAAGSSGSGGFFDGLLKFLPSVTGIISGIGSVFSGIVGAFSGAGSFILSAAEFLPVIAGVAAVVGGIWKFVEGFSDASSVFGEKVGDDEYMKRIYGGFVNVVSSILGIFDTVAGWLGFDTDLEKGFKEGAKKLFNAILDSFKGIVGGLADLLSYIPGMGDTAKAMKAYAESKSGGFDSPPTVSQAGTLNDKTNNVNDLKDQVDASKSKGASATVVQDNSVKQNSTTLVNQKMSTRNDDMTTLAMYGL